MTSVPTASAPDEVVWEEDGREHTARWRSESGQPPPRRIHPFKEAVRAERVHRLVSSGSAILWRGDYHQAREVVDALARRIDRTRNRRSMPTDLRERFHRERMARTQRAQLLGRVLVPLEAGYVMPLGRAPDVRAACTAAWGPGPDGTLLVSLRDVLGAIGAFEWQRKGVWVEALDARIHPGYGVFSPVRGEYVDLVAQAPLPAGAQQAFDIGTGTGVLASLLARRGLAVVATDLDARALACARDTVTRLELTALVRVEEADLFPAGRADVVVCNPPWLPGRATTPLERAVYDPDSAMLHGFIDGVAEHLTPHGEAWLILSDLAEHLGLRRRDDLLARFAQAGLRVIERHETSPRHARARDADDALHAARRAERTSLWRLAAA